MLALSLREAAQQAGVSKSTIFRAVQSGRLSAGRNSNEWLSIEPAELFQVDEPSNGARNGKRDGAQPTATAVLQARIVGLALGALVVWGWCRAARRPLRWVSL